MTVFWSDEAEQDLDAVFHWYLRSSELAAREQVRRIRQRTATLEQFPDLGRVVPEFSNPRVRELVEGDYRIMYERFVDRVEVFAIVHGRQSFIPESKQE